MYICDKLTHTLTRTYMYHTFQYTHTHTHTHFLHKTYLTLQTIIVIVADNLQRSEHFLHDVRFLRAVTVEITQILTRAGFTLTQVYLNPS